MLPLQPRRSRFNTYKLRSNTPISPRLQKSLLQCPKREGGLTLPYISRYFQASLVEYFMEWNCPMTEKYWVFMDQTVAGHHIWREAWLLRSARTWGLYSSSVTRPTLLTWDTDSSRANLTTFPSPMTPIFLNPDFPTGMDRRVGQHGLEGGCNAWDICLK